MFLFTFLVMCPAARIVITNKIDDFCINHHKRFLSDGKSLLYLGQSVCLLVGWYSERDLFDETHGSMHLNEKSLL